MQAEQDEERRAYHAHVLRSEMAEAGYEWGGSEEDSDGYAIGRYDYHMPSTPTSPPPISPQPDYSPQSISPQPDYPPSPDQCMYSPSQAPRDEEMEGEAEDDRAYSPSQPPRNESDAEGMEFSGDEGDSTAAAGDSTAAAEASTAAAEASTAEQAPPAAPSPIPARQDGDGMEDSEVPETPQSSPLVTPQPSSRLGSERHIRLTQLASTHLDYNTFPGGIDEALDVMYNTSPDLSGLAHPDPLTHLGPLLNMPPLPPLASLVPCPPPTAPSPTALPPTTPSTPQVAQSPGAGLQFFEDAFGDRYTPMAAIVVPAVESAVVAAPAAIHPAALAQMAATAIQPAVSFDVVADTPPESPRTLSPPPESQQSLSEGGGDEESEYATSEAVDSDDEEELRYRAGNQPAASSAPVTRARAALALRAATHPAGSQVVPTLTRSAGARPFGTPTVAPRESSFRQTLLSPSHLSEVDRRVFDYCAFSDPDMLQIKYQSPLMQQTAFSFDESRISGPEFLTLKRENRWVSDGVIKGYSKIIMLRNDMLFKDNMNRVIILDPNFSVRIRQPDPVNHHRHLVAWVTRQMTSETAVFVLPMFTDDRHWFTVIVDIKRGKIRSIETLDRDHTFVVTRIKDFFELYWPTIGGGRRRRRWSVRQLTPSKSPEQFDTFNCGVFCCAIMDLYCFGIKIANMKYLVNKHNIADIRKRIAIFMEGFNYT